MPTPAARRTYNHFLTVQEDMLFELRKTLQRAASEVEREILKITGKTVGAVVAREQLRAIKKSLHEKIAELYREQGYIVQASRQEAAAASIKAFQEYEKVFLKKVMTRAELDAYLESAMVSSRAGVNAVMRRVMGQSYRPLSYSVYQTEKLSRGMVDRYVETALAKNMTAKEFAKGVRSMINPNVKGGVSYASERLARTEINNAFHSFSEYKYRTSKLVLSVDWNLSGSHPEGDVCDDLVSGSPYPKWDIPNKPHPMCFCYITPVMPSEDEFLDTFFAGGYGDTWDADWDE